MEYVADELGVGVLKLPALQRPLSVRADTSAILQLRELIRERRPDVLHTHTAKAGATGRLGALSPRDELGRGRSSTPTTVTSSAATSAAAGSTSSAGSNGCSRTRRRALVAVSDEVRDDLVGFGVAPAERFTVVPYGFDLPEWGPADEEARVRVRGELGLGDDTLRDRLGRSAHRDQAAARPRADAARGRDDGVDAVLVLVGDGEERGRKPRRSRASSASPTTAASSASSSASASWYAAVRRLRSSPPRTRARLSSRSRRSRPSGRSSRRDAGGTATVVTDGDSGYLRAGRRHRRARRPARRARARPRAARDARPARAPPTSASASPPSAWPTTSRPSTGTLLAREGPAPPQAHAASAAPSATCSRCCRRSARPGVDARFLGLDVPGQRRAALLRAARRSSACPHRSRPLRRRPQPADGPRRGARGAGGAARPAAHASRPRGRLRRDRGARRPRMPFVSTRHNDDRYLLGPFRYVDRAFARRRAAADRDLRRRAAVPRAGRS